MTILKTAINPIDGAKSIIVYEGVGNTRYLIYPVKIDEQLLHFHLDKDGFWKPVDASHSIPAIICRYIGDMIKQADN